MENWAFIAFYSISSRFTAKNQLNHQYLSRPTLREISLKVWKADHYGKICSRIPVDFDSKIHRSSNCMRKKCLILDTNAYDKKIFCEARHEQSARADKAGQYRWRALIGAEEKLKKTHSESTRVIRVIILVRLYLKWSAFTSVTGYKTIQRLFAIAKDTEERFRFIRHLSEPNVDIIYSAGIEEEASGVSGRLRANRTDR